MSGSLPLYIVGDDNDGGKLLYGCGSEMSRVHTFSSWDVLMSSVKNPGLSDELPSSYKNKLLSNELINEYLETREIVFSFCH